MKKLFIAILILLSLNSFAQLTRIEAEAYTAMSGVQILATGDGGNKVGYIDTGDWMDYTISLPPGTYTFKFRVASGVNTAAFEMRSSVGTVLTTVFPTNTGGSFDVFETQIKSVVISTAITGIRIISTGAGGWDFNWFEYQGGTLAVDAGTDSTLTISPVGTRWNQTATDTGYLNASVLGNVGTTTYLWTKTSGPAGHTFHNPTGLYNPVSGLAASGTYVFRLTATDANGSSFSEVTYTMRSCTTSYSATIAPSGDGGALVNLSGFLPGVNLWIDSTNDNFSYIFVNNSKGAPGCYNKIENIGHVVMPNGIAIENSEWTEFSGLGTMGGAGNKRGDGVPLGITVRGKFKDTLAGVYQTYAAGGAIAVSTHLSNNIWIHNIEGTRLKYGLQIKDDDQCDTLYNYPNGVQWGHVIENNYMHYLESQGMYIGNTEPENSRTLTRVKNCPALGGNVYLNPGRLGDMLIRNNWIDSTGRPGIQLSVGEVGMNRITKNKITFTGCQNDPAQGPNIAIGGHTNAIIDSNELSNALNYNIQSTGGQKLYIYNNILDSGGYSAHHSRWTYQTPGNPATPVVGALADTATYIGYGSNLHFRADSLAIPFIQQQAWIRNNTLTAAAIRTEPGVAATDRYVMTFYGTTANADWRWTGDNRIEGNTYGGAAIANVAGFVNAETSFMRPIATTIPYIPQVSAGRDYRIKHNYFQLLGNVATLSGNTVSTYNWQQTGGPSFSTIVTPLTAKTFISGLVNGTYKYQLTATDNVGTSRTDSVSIEVSGVSAAALPTANAGADQPGVIISSVYLAGSGIAASGETISGYQWEKISGPGSPGFSSTTTANVTITGLLSGVYVFRLTVTQTDSQTDTDDVQVTVTIPVAPTGTRTQYLIVK